MPARNTITNADCCRGEAECVSGLVSTVVIILFACTLACNISISSLGLSDFLSVANPLLCCLKMSLLPQRKHGWKPCFAFEIHFLSFSVREIKKIVGAKGVHGVPFCHFRHFTLCEIQNEKQYSFNTEKNATGVSVDREKYKVLILHKKDHSYFITPRSRIPAERLLLPALPFLSSRWQSQNRDGEIRRMLEDGWEEREHTESGVQERMRAHTAGDERDGAKRS